MLELLPFIMLYLAVLTMTHRLIIDYVSYNDSNDCLIVILFKLFMCS